MRAPHQSSGQEGLLVGWSANTDPPPPYMPAPSCLNGYARSSYAPAIRLPCTAQCTCYAPTACVPGTGHVLAERVPGGSDLPA